MKERKKERKGGAWIADQLHSNWCTLAVRARFFLGFLAFLGFLFLSFAGCTFGTISFCVKSMYSQIREEVSSDAFVVNCNIELDIFLKTF